MNGSEFRTNVASKGNSAIFLAFLVSRLVSWPSADVFVVVGDLERSVVEGEPSRWGFHFLATLVALHFTLVSK